MTEEIQGVKVLAISAKTRYPIVSAYEFEFLKTEKIVQAILEPCTLYIIAQRPLTYINNLKMENGCITFDIADGTGTSPLRCSFSPEENGFSKPDEELLISIQFYKPNPDKSPPFNMVAGIKLLTLDEEFIIWLTPQKILYEFLLDRLKMTIIGDVSAYIDYRVHYIGKSFSQHVWDRLTGHEKMQRILTLEDAIDQQANKSSFEISLIMLHIEGFDEGNIFPDFEYLLPKDCKPIIFQFSFEDNDDRFEKYYVPHLQANSEELTNEVEAMLINSFKPEYNDIKFDNYPEIKNGTRSAGYSTSYLVIQQMPARLFTEHYHVDLIIPKKP